MTPPYVVAIVQARLGSTRFPRKVLADLCGRPVLHHVIRRAQQARLVDEVFVAAPRVDWQSLALQHAVWTLCRTRCESESNEADVLTRFRDVTDESHDIVVRLTGDCPLVPPEAIDGCIRGVLDGYDYVTTSHPDSGWQDGEDAEAFTLTALNTLHEQVTDLAEREHVTVALRTRDFGFRRGVYTKAGSVIPFRSETYGSEWSQEKWSIDTPADLERVAARLRAEHAV